MRALVLAALLPSLFRAAPALADPLQDQVLAGMRRTNTSDVAFTDMTLVERTGAAAKEITSRYDPRQPAGRRWAGVRVDGRAPPPKAAAARGKGAHRDPPPSYAHLATWFGAPATRVGQTATTVTYRFARLPAGTLKIASHDASADTIAEVVVNTAGREPLAEHVRFTSAASFRIMLIARVDRYVMNSSYAPLPDGRPFATGIDADMSGSLAGKGGSLKTRTRITP